MIVVAYQRTMAGAKRLIDEKRKKPTPKRDALIALVERWKEEERARRESLKASSIARLRTTAMNVAQNSVPIVPYTAAADIIAQVAFWHGVEPYEITGPGRSWLVVAARFDAAAALHLNCRIVGRKLTLAEIGRYLGGRDHSTIFMALKQRGLRN